MPIEFSNNTFAIVVRYLKARLCIQIVRVLSIMIKSVIFFSIYILFGFTIKRLAFTKCYDRPSLVEVLVGHQLSCHSM